MLEFIVLKMCKRFLHTLAISIPLHSLPVVPFVLDAFRLSAVQSSITFLSFAFPHPLLKFQLIAIDSNCEAALRCRTTRGIPQIHSPNAFMRLVRSLISAWLPAFPTAAPPIFASDRQFSLCSSPFYVYCCSLFHHCLILRSAIYPVRSLCAARIDIVTSSLQRRLRLSWGAANSNKRIYCSFARADESSASREKTH